jgi:GDP/UDP-N,N'-diacetylbacillosamine 2-epimerase (hydrolysing)
VLRAIERHVARSPARETRVFRSLRRDDYLRAMLQADVLIGNSSSGLIEAPLAGTPTVNVGPRQAGRQPGGPTIVQTTESPTAIRTGLRSALRKHPRRGGRNVYGDGRAGPRIAKILAELRLTTALVRKRITY